MIAELIQQLKGHGYHVSVPEILIDSRIHFFDAYEVKDGFLIGKFLQNKGGEFIVAKFGSWKLGEVHNYISANFSTSDDLKIISGELEGLQKELELSLQKFKKIWGSDKSVLRKSNYAASKTIASIQEIDIEKILQKPTIILKGQQEHEKLLNIESMLTDLGKNNDFIFIHLGRIALLNRCDDKLKLEVLSKDQLLTFLAKNTNWKRQTKDELVNVDVSERIVKHFYSSPPKMISELTEIKTMPFFSSNFELNSSNGYYKNEKVYLDTKLVLPDYLFQNYIDKSIVLDSLNILLDLCHDFPFTTIADKLNYLTTLFHPIVRSIYSGPSPLFIINATRPGTGKTLLADVSWMIQLGTLPHAMILPTREEEQVKQITASFLKNQKIFYYDNLKSSKLDSSVLAKIATQESWSERLLGTNEKFECKNHSCWIFTVNNLSATTEIARRSPRIRLESKLDSRVQRKVDEFKYPNIKNYVSKNRDQILIAIITLVQNWINQGSEKPSHGRYLESFESWSDLFGGIFEAAGMDGFLTGQNDYLETIDDDFELLEEFLHLWWKSKGNTPVKAGELLLDFGISELVTQIVNPKSHLALPGDLGKLLKSLNGQIRGGFRVSLTKDKGSKIGRYYSLELLGEGGVLP